VARSSRFGGSAPAPAEAEAAAEPEEAAVVGAAAAAADDDDDDDDDADDDADDEAEAADLIDGGISHTDRAPDHRRGRRAVACVLGSREKSCRLYSSS